MSSLIRSMPLGMFLLMLAFPLAMSAILVVAGVTARRRAALIRSTPAAHIATAADGYCQLEGRAEAVAGQTLAAPLTGAACVWYRARVERFTHGGLDKETVSKTVSEVTCGAPFFIRDGGGRGTIRPFGAEVTPTDKSEWHGTTSVPQDRNPPRVRPTDSRPFLVEAPPRPADDGGTYSYRYYEERIYDGDPLLVLGYFTRDAHQDGDDNDDFEEQAGPAPQGPNGAADREADAEDGDSTSLEIEDPATEQLVRQLFERAAQETTSVVSCGSGERPFVLTTTPKERHVDLSARGGNAAIGLALVPLALAALLLWTRSG
jgi:hypothetical protein